MDQKLHGDHHFFLGMTALVAALGGFLFGYDTGIISGALEFMVLQNTRLYTVMKLADVISNGIYHSILKTVGGRRASFEAFSSEEVSLKK